MFDASKTSTLGFGAMRFARDEDGKINIDTVKEMVDYYISQGGNYFDTAWAYPDSEAALKEALVDRYPRDSYTIATKVVAWTCCEKPEDLETQLQQSLANLGVGYVDIYLMHNLGAKRTAAFEKFKVWEFMKSVKERGLAKHIGFSAHCTPDELEKFIADYPDAELVQLQVNYADWDNPSFKERECVEIANKHNIPIVVMEPVRGGILANPPQCVKRVFDEKMPQYSYAACALRFAANVPGVITTLSGMNTLDMVKENCAALANFQGLSADDAAIFAEAQKAMDESGIVPCTGCNYCAKVCPQEIGISQSLTALNYYITFEDAAMAKGQLGMLVGFNAGKQMITECIECGACEDACPQKISILDCFERIKNEILPVELPEHKGVMRKSL